MATHKRSLGKCTRTVVAAMAVLLSYQAALADPIELRSQGKKVRSWTLEELRKQFKVVELKIDGGKSPYRCVAVSPLLKQAYGDPYKGQPDFFFVCSDGYRAAVPAAELSKYPAYLAFERSDGKPFLLPEEQNKKLAPYYLIWDTNKFPDRKALASWPYQVVAIDRESLADRYPNVPPKDSSPEVKRGFKAFCKYCISCHQINGQGGQMAVDLNYPLNVTDYIKEPYLAKIIDNPTAVRGRATMPPLAKSIPNRSQMIADIVSFLKAKAKEPKVPPKK